MCKRETLTGPVICNPITWTDAGQRSPVHFKTRGMIVDAVQDDGTTFYRLAAIQDNPNDGPAYVLIGDCEHTTDGRFNATVYRSFWDNYPHSHAILRTFVGMCNLATGHSTNPDNDPYNLTHYITASGAAFEQLFQAGVMQLA